MRFKKKNEVSNVVISTHNIFYLLFLVSCVVKCDTVLRLPSCSRHYLHQPCYFFQI